MVQLTFCLKTQSTQPAAGAQPAWSTGPGDGAGTSASPGDRRSCSTCDGTSSGTSNEDISPRNHTAPTERLASSNHLTPAHTAATSHLTGTRGAAGHSSRCSHGAGAGSTCGACGSSGAGAAAANRPATGHSTAAPAAPRAESAAAAADAAAGLGGCGAELAVNVAGDCRPLGKSPEVAGSCGQEQSRLFVLRVTCVGEAEVPIAASGTLQRQALARLARAAEEEIPEALGLHVRLSFLYTPLGGRPELYGHSFSGPRLRIQRRLPTAPRAASWHGQSPRCSSTFALRQPAKNCSCWQKSWPSRILQNRLLLGRLR
ncbi:unnamed protein product [Effrenium voratum]|nr:unnamed protein product [Effrenium voratum]